MWTGDAIQSERRIAAGLRNADVGIGDVGKMRSGGRGPVSDIQGDETAGCERESILRRRHAGANTGTDEREPGEEAGRASRDAKLWDRGENGGRTLHRVIYERTQARGRKPGRVV